MKSIVSRLLSVHKEHEFLLKLEAAGLCGELAKRVIDSKDNYIAKKVIRLIQNRGFELSTEQRRALDIMGSNMNGVEQAIKHLGLNLRKQELDAFSTIPYSEATLEECKSTHNLVAVPSISINDIQKKVPQLCDYNENSWYNKLAFAKDKGIAGWHLVRNRPVANSTLKTWDEQQDLLGENEETPYIRVMVYAIIIHCISTSERLFENVCVRCSDLDPSRFRMGIGFYPNGLKIFGYFSAYDKKPHIWIASERIPS